uniref:Uncharacterized protein n=1 Tax=Eutreptiella gymnastica TaxID=73025 RepID=A0A7S1JAD2_9EUGL
MPQATDCRHTLPLGRKKNAPFEGQGGGAELCTWLDKPEIQGNAIHDTPISADCLPYAKDWGWDKYLGMTDWFCIPHCTIATMHAALCTVQVVAPDLCHAP